MPMIFGLSNRPMYSMLKSSLLGLAKTSLILALIFFIAAFAGTCCSVQYHFQSLFLNRWNLLLKPRKSKLPFPKYISASLVFSVCSVNSSFFRIQFTAIRASCACVFRLHNITKSSAYHTSSPKCPKRLFQYISK